MSSAPLEACKPEEIGKQNEFTDGRLRETLIQHRPNTSQASAVVVGCMDGWSFHAGQSSRETRRYTRYLKLISLQNNARLLGKTLCPWLL